MLFNSLEFLIFLPITLFVYYRLNTKGQNIWLLLASWFFYGWWDYRFLALIGISTVVDYWCGQNIDQATSKQKKRRFLLLSIVTNLSILGFFKYFNFFADSFLIILEWFHLEPSFPILSILLPMGISFYTFQTMAYTIEIYRGNQKPTSSLINFALYVCYFPQLVAGPIERASHLLPQLASKRVITYDKINQGLILILLGFFKKIALADTAAVIVNQTFSNPHQFTSLDLIIGTYAFAIQIFCDFSGYTDIARGTSKLIGIDLMENFKHPYFSKSITEFWRKWHISLSTWLRDYLYIPLGGNRYGQLYTYRNLMLTMLLGGLWHGASWNFVIWGALHGLYLGVERVFRKPKKDPLSISPSFLNQYLIPIGKTILTFHLVCFAWIFFRSTEFSLTIEYLSGIFSFSSLTAIKLDVFILLRVLPCLLLLLFIEIWQNKTNDHTFIRHKGLLFQFGFFTLLLAGIFLFGAFDQEVPFIYFQF